MSATSKSPGNKAPLQTVFGMASFFVAALCTIPSPFFLGIILTPGFVSIAVMSFLGKRWSWVVGAGASGLTILLALVSFGSVFSQPNVEMVLATVLASLIVLMGAAFGLLGTGLVRLGMHRRSRSTGTAPTPWNNSRSDAGFRDRRKTAPETAAYVNPTVSHEHPNQWRSQQGSNPDSDASDGWQRFGRFASDGAYRMAKGSFFAWQEHRERVADRHSRAAMREKQAEASGKIPPLRFSTQDMERRKRQKENEEVRKARVTQARKYNNRNSPWF